MLVQNRIKAKESLSILGKHTSTEEAGLLAALDSAHARPLLTDGLMLLMLPCPLQDVPSSSSPVTSRFHQVSSHDLQRQPLRPVPAGHPDMR